MPQRHMPEAMRHRHTVIHSALYTGLVVSGEGSSGGGGKEARIVASLSRASPHEIGFAGEIVPT